jgi:Na+-transporting NADH:ubiquinone oxidoreductase subunit B
LKFLQNIFDKQAKHFKEGGKLSRLHPLYEATYTFIFTPGTVTKGAPHIRDGMDFKRLMVTVVVALIPAVFMALYNTGLQANMALQQMGSTDAGGWRGWILDLLGTGLNPNNLLDNITHGALYFFPVYIITLAAGGLWEVLFSAVRKHPISEGFLVTSLLFPLILPPDIPWWQTILGISFGVVFGKEIFGGVGMNVLNPALSGRVFLYFAYPGQISGDSVWVAVDGFSRATPLAEFADPLIEVSVSIKDAFLGIIPGSMGETSTLACLIGALILIVTKVGSWRVMLGVFLGMIAFSSLFNWVGSETNPMFQVTPLWHFITGGFAFGMVFMATDPVSAAHTQTGQYWYGLLIGVMTVLIRVINPGFPEGIMLAILFGNVFAPAIDKIFVNKNIKRRQLQYGER